MASTNWALRDDQTLAEYVPLEDFEGILQKRIGISPDYAALLIRDGKLAESFVGAHISVGGIWQNIKQWIGGTHAVRLLVANLKPFQVEGEITGLSADQTPIGATVSFEFQLNPEKPANILGMMKEISSLTHADIYNRLMPHLKDRVFDSVLRKIEAKEIRGNPDLQDKLQADIMVETARLFGDIGLMVRSVSVNWSLNDEELTAIEQRKVTREQELLDYEFECKKREMERENQAKEFVIRSDLATEKLQSTSEDELKHLILQQEFGFIDARDEGLRTQEVKKLNHEIELLNVERQVAYTKALEDARNEVERAAIRKRLTEVELEIEEMKKLQNLKLVRIEEEQNLDISIKARKQQLESLRGLNDVELDAQARQRQMDRDDRLTDHKMGIESKQLDSESELEKLRTQAGMSADQILAINAGLSPDVAKIFTERAKAEGVDADKQEALLREMVEMSKENRAASDDQARFMFDKAMQGVAAVSKGADIKPSSAAESAEAAPNSVECSACHRQVPTSDRFCRFCGQQMRV